MCSIAGILDLRGAPVSREVVERMNAVQRHRGPDDAGIHVDGPVGLGNRRLAIIDLSPAGHQPICNEDGSVWIVYNGELYNFRQLRQELAREGHRFASASDTEVIVHAYEEWGEDCVQRFNGMFAFAIWDQARQRLLLARDRYGIKPLYYWRNDRELLFASEIKALLSHPDVSVQVDADALREYFTFQNVYSGRTLFEGVRLLPAGHVMTVDARTGTTESRQYWDFDLSHPFSTRELPRAECAQEVRRLFEQAVQRQLVSDVPIGSFLSGGMDSGSIVAVASRLIPRLMTFTAGFDTRAVEGLEATFDERGPAEVLAHHFGTEHYSVSLHAGDMRWVLPELNWHVEDPRAGMAWQDFYADRLASRFVSVCLSGVGGDELFAGYPWRYARAADALTVEEFHKRYYTYWQRLVPENEHPAFFCDAVLQSAPSGPYEQFLRVFPSNRSPYSPHDFVSGALYFELKTFLHAVLLVADKLSMAHSLELRVPFLDNDFVDFALRIPLEYKLNRVEAGVPVRAGLPSRVQEPFRQSSEGKRVLREAMRGLIPTKALERPKQGFSPPDEAWYRGSVLPYIQEVLLSPRSLDRGFLQPNYVRRVIQEHAAGAANHRLLIWSLLSFEWWCRAFMDKESIPEAQDRLRSLRGTQA